MISDRKKIDEALDFGKEKLAQRSELKDMSFGQILDVLDDGTHEMMYNRWGVLAQVIIHSITSWETRALGEYLAQINCPDVACEFVGYALQNSHGIILEKLLIDAAECGHFDKVVKYVDSNLQHKTKLNLQFLSPFLQTLEQDTTHHSYCSVLYHYAQGIAACDGCLDVVKQLNPIDREVKYHLLYNMRCFWFEQNPIEAKKQIRIFLSQNSQWAWKIAIDYCERSLLGDKFTLEEFYPQIDRLVSMHDELKVYVIPLLIEYMLQTCEEKENHPQYETITSKLKQLLHQSSQGVSKFLQKIEYARDYPDGIVQILQEVLSVAIDTPDSVLTHLDTCFLSLLEKKNYQVVIGAMFTFFSSNQYGVNYLKFFDSFASTLSALSKYAIEITDFAITYIISPNKERLFFGLGLLEKLGDIKGLYLYNIEKDPGYSGQYDEQQLIRVMKAVLYFSIADEPVCHIAFLLLYFARDTSVAYLQFCMNSVFFDYPVKMHEISKSYLDSELPAHVELVSMVEKAYITREALLEKAQYTPDLYPSPEHQVIYRRAQQKQSREISKRASEMSVLSQLCSRVVLKFGRRSAHIVKESKDRQVYQFAPYREFRCECHLPVTYVTDPNEYSIRRYDFLKEVENDAPNS